MFFLLKLVKHCPFQMIPAALEFFETSSGVPEEIGFSPVEAVFALMSMHRLM